MTTATAIGSEYELIPIGKIDPSKTNAREDFNKTDLNELAADIGENGIIQAIVVRQKPKSKTRYEIIAGERRYRASIIADLKEIPCHIVEADDVKAVLLQASENLRRKDLNPIEEASTFQLMLEVTKKTQTELAKDYGFKQSHISNRLRLLNLPKPWQKKLIKQEIQLTFGRELATWVEYPQVFKALDEEIESFKNNQYNSDALDIDDYRNCLDSALDEVSRGVNYGDFKITEELEKELQVEVVPESVSGFSNHKIAFNVKRFDQLQEEEKQKKVAKQNKSGAGNNSKRNGSKENGTLFDIGDDGGSKDGRTPKQIEADIKQADHEAEKKRKELLDRKYADWKCAWFQEAIGDLLDHRKPTDGFLFKMLLFFTVTRENGINDFRRQRLSESVKTWGGRLARGGVYDYSSKVWAGLTSAKSSSKDLAATTLGKFVRIPIEHSAFSHNQIGDLAKELAIDFEKDWTLTEDFLQLHTKPQLLDLVDEWSLPDTGLKNMKGEALIDAILTMYQQRHLEFKKNKSGKVKPVPAPKALVRVKLPK